MSTFEIILLIGAGLVPIIALLMVVPKFKRKKHLIPPETMPYISSEKESLEVNKEVESKEKSVVNSNDKKNEDTDEFKDYLNYKKSTINRPVRNELPADYKDNTMPYMRRRMDKNKEHKTIIEQVNALSPELLTMMISGVFDKKVQ